MMDQEKWGPLVWERCFSFTIEATLTDAKWAAHVPTGARFGTAAWDVYMG